MLVAAVRIVMTLILVALVPYTLTVVAVVILWFDERFYEIARKNPTGRDPLIWPHAQVGIRPREALHLPKGKLPQTMGSAFAAVRLGHSVPPLER
jgi:hypothetical protein